MAPTRVCVLTPEGPGAIAVLRVWGPRAVEVADAVFRPHRGSPLPQRAKGRPRFGRVRAGRGDEVVAVVIEGEPPEVEIHGHGGPARSSWSSMPSLPRAPRRQPVAWVRRDAAIGRRGGSATSTSHAQATLRSAEILFDQAGALEQEARRLIAVPQRPSRTRPCAGRSSDCSRIRGRSSTDLRLAGRAGGPAECRQEPAAQ